MIRRVFLSCVLVGLSGLGCSDDGASGGSPGGGAGTSSTSAVTFAEMCPVPPDCGGDPTGSWTLRSACVMPPPGGFQCADGLQTARGTIDVGTLTVRASDYELDLDVTLRQCGWVDGRSSGSSGSLVITGNTMEFGSGRVVTFCVEGDTLWFYEPEATYRDFAVHEFRRSTE